jgi:hypothetical protein
MRHTIKFPPDWPNVRALEKHLSARFLGSTFEFTPDSIATKPEYEKTYFPPELAIVNAANGALCNLPVNNDIDHAISEFLAQNQ